MLRVITLLHSVWGRLPIRLMLWLWVRVVQLQQTLLMCRLLQLVQLPMAARLNRLPAAAKWFPVTKFQLVRPVTSAKSNMLHQVLLRTPVPMPSTAASYFM